MIYRVSEYMTCRHATTGVSKTVGTDLSTTSELARTGLLVLRMVQGGFFNHQPSADFIYPGHQE